jgi:uncharacterized protein involved in exopolysaccharide biosynthesis
MTAAARPLPTPTLVNTQPAPEPPRVPLRRLLAAMALGGLAAAGITLATPATYPASASVVPSTGDDQGLSRLAGLAAQLGAAPALGNASQSPDFYVDLARSSSVLREVAQRTYPTARGPLTLAAYYGIREASDSATIERVVERLRTEVKVATIARTGVVTIRWESRQRDLSAAVVGTVVRALDNFDATRRRTQAARLRSFLEGQLAGATAELRRADENLIGMLERNRNVVSDARTARRLDVLRREVATRELQLQSLRSSVEQARIEEVKSLPVLTVVEPPVAPVLAAPRHLALKTILGVIAGGACFFTALLFLAWFDVAARGPSPVAAWVATLGRPFATAGSWIVGR